MKGREDKELTLPSPPSFSQPVLSLLSLPSPDVPFSSSSSVEERGVSVEGRVKRGVSVSLLSLPSFYRNPSLFCLKKRKRGRRRDKREKGG